MKAFWFAIFLIPATVIGQQVHTHALNPALGERGADNLYLVGKVWGYLKYHHPVVTNGCLDWDQALLDRLPEFRDMDRRDNLIAKIDAWVASLDNIKLSTECGEPTREVAESRPTEWITDPNLVGQQLSRRLQKVNSIQSTGVDQHYVSLRAGVGNPFFQNEPYYRDVENLDWRYRVLALYRFWNIVEYWSPYRSLISSNFDDVLREFVTTLYSADEPNEYALALMMLTATVEDAHTNLWSAIEERPPSGTAIASFSIRFVQGHPIVWRKLAIDPSADSDASTILDELKIGDIIHAINGESIDELVGAWTPYYGVSNDATLFREIARNLLRGAEGQFDLDVERNGRRLRVSANRIDAAHVDLSTTRAHDVEGEAFQHLENGISYVKLSTITASDVARFNEHIEGSHALIVDIRGYPKTGVVFSIGQHLVNESTSFARFTGADLSRPGSFYWSEPASITPKEPYFDGLVVILVDETTQSAAEYTAMAFRASPRSVVIGSQTAGADGNVSHIPLPGGHRTMISGIGVFYPDKRPTQKIGIVPDVEVRPTIKGIRAGRDEVLEAAVEYIHANSGNVSTRSSRHIIDE